MQVRPGRVQPEPLPRPVNQQQRRDLPHLLFHRHEPDQVVVEGLEHLVDIRRSAFGGDIYIFKDAYAPEALRKLKADAHRWALYALWWKWRKGERQSEYTLPPPGFDPAAYSQAVTSTLPGLIDASARLVAARQALVPQPVVRAGDTRQDSFQRGISQFAAGKGLAPGKVLKPAATARSWRATQSAPAPMGGARTLPPNPPPNTRGASA